MKIYRNKKVIFLSFVGLYLLYCVGYYVVNPSDAKPVANVSSSSEPICAVDSTQLLKLINQERSKVGVDELIANDSLINTSTIKYNDMISNKYYGHNLLDGNKYTKILYDSGINVATAEDIVNDTMTPNEQWKYFKESPSHYQSLISPNYKYIGIKSGCTDYVAEHVTGPDDNTSLMNHRMRSLTVVQLAAPDLVSLNAVSSDHSSSQRPSTYKVSGPTCNQNELANQRSLYSQAVAAENKLHETKLESATTLTAQNDENIRHTNTSVHLLDLEQSTERSMNC